MDEIWKDIEGYEGYYQVSNLGKVRSLDRVSTNIDGKKIPLKGRVLVLSFSSSYYKVNIIKEGKRKTFNLHRLVAEAFCEGEKSLEVNHIDGNKFNNNYYNLEFVTGEYNREHATNLGLVNNKGEDSGTAKLKEEQVLEIRGLKGKFTQSDIGRMFNVSRTTISFILSNKRWKHI